MLMLYYQYFNITNFGFDILVQDDIVKEFIQALKIRCKKAVIL